MSEPFISAAAFETEDEFEARLRTYAPEFQRWERLDRIRALWIKEYTERLVAALEALRP